MVQNVRDIRSDFHIASFIDSESLLQVHVELEARRTCDSVFAEAADLAWCRIHQQRFALTIEDRQQAAGAVKRISRCHAGTDRVFVLFQRRKYVWRFSGQLDNMRLGKVAENVRRISSGVLPDCHLRASSSTEGHGERRSSRPSEDRTELPLPNELLDEGRRRAQESAVRSEGKRVGPITADDVGPVKAEKCLVRVSVFRIPCKQVVISVRQTKIPAPRIRTLACEALRQAFGDLQLHRM